MYVCLCNPFTDKDVKDALDSGAARTAGQVYKTCSGGQKPCCGTCLCMVRDIVKGHRAQRDAAEDALPLAAE